MRTGAGTAPAASGGPAGALQPLSTLENVFRILWESLLGMWAWFMADPPAPPAVPSTQQRGGEGPRGGPAPTASAPTTAQRSAPSSTRPRIATLADLNASAEPPRTSGGASTGRPGATSFYNGNSTQFNGRAARDDPPAPPANGARNAAANDDPADDVY